MFSISSATSGFYTLSLHDALPISVLTGEVIAFAWEAQVAPHLASGALERVLDDWRSEEHTSELQSLRHLVCRLLLEKKKCLTKWISRTSRQPVWSRHL